MSTPSIALTEEEMVALMNEARADNPLHAIYGARRLIVCPENLWAFARLAEIRGEDPGVMRKALTTALGITPEPEVQVPERRQA